MPTSKVQDVEIEGFAEACLSYLISAPEELARFMDYAGIDGDGLRQSVGSPGLAAGLLDYFAQNEAALLAMCANSGLDASRFMHIWQKMNPDHV